MQNFDDYNVWLSYYGNQALQTGYGIEGFHGTPYQRGAGLGSFFKSLFRMAVPVIKSVGRQVGKHALTAGANVMADLVEGRPVIDSVKKHSRSETSKILHEVGDRLQEGQGLGRAPKSIDGIGTDVFSKISDNKQNGSRRRKLNPQY